MKIELSDLEASKLRACIMVQRIRLEREYDRLDDKAQLTPRERARLDTLQDSINHYAELEKKFI